MNTLQQEPTGLYDNTISEATLDLIKTVKRLFPREFEYLNKQAIATARADGEKRERERIVQIINNHKYGSPKSCDESYWYTRGDRLIKSQVYFEALTDVLEAIKGGTNAA